MAYGDYNGPDKLDKGQENGSCARTLCQCNPARWYNHGSFKWYCDDCRKAIQFDVFDLRDWERNWQPQVGHPMFETRQMMNKREAGLEPATSRSLIERANQTALHPEAALLPQAENTPNSSAGNSVDDAPFLIVHKHTNIRNGV